MLKIINILIENPEFVFKYMCNHVLTHIRLFLSVSNFIRKNYIPHYRVSSSSSMKNFRSDSKDSGVSGITFRNDSMNSPSCSLIVDSFVIRKPSVIIVPYEANLENILSWDGGPFAKKGTSESNPTSKIIFLI